MGEMQTVIFSLNDELFGVDTSQVQEIVKYQEIVKVPQMPDFVDGLLNLRGKVVPVVNLNKRFELGETDIGKKTKIIITKIDENLAGFIVNDVSEIIKLSEEDIEMPPEIIHKTGNSYLQGVGKKDGKLISILDLSRILNVNEAKSLFDKKMTIKEKAQI